MNDIAANLTDLLDKTIGVFAAGLAGGVGLALGLRAAGWKPNPGTTVNFFEGGKSTSKPTYVQSRQSQPAHTEQPTSQGGIIFTGPKSDVIVIPPKTHIDVLMEAIKFDDELLSEDEIKLLRGHVREAVLKMCPKAFRITDTKNLSEYCSDKTQWMCGQCWVATWKK